LPHQVGYPLEEQPTGAKTVPANAQAFQEKDRYTVILKRNYAKSVTGLSTRIIAKIASVTVLQFLHFIHNKPIGKLKYALLF
jgi:hypothetical protein